MQKFLIEVSLSAKLLPPAPTAFDSERDVVKLNFDSFFSSITVDPAPVSKTKVALVPFTSAVR